MGGVLVSPSMVQTVGGGLLVSPSLAQPRDCTLRGAASSCRNSKTARSLFRVSVLCSAASSSRYRGVRHPPRVVIVVPARGSTSSSCRNRWLNPVGLADWVGLPIPHSCHYCGTNPRFDFLLASLPWFKPGERLSVANGWMCQYPWCKNTGVRTMVQTGGKLTCRNSKTARNRGFVVVFARSKP